MSKSSVAATSKIPATQLPSKLIGSTERKGGLSPSYLLRTSAQGDAAAVANGTGIGGVGGPGTRTTKRMQFTFSVNEDQHSASSSTGFQPGNGTGSSDSGSAGYTAQPTHVDKPDLKPSAEFSVGKRARGAGFGAGTASVKHSTNAASSVSSTSTNAATVAAKPNDHAHDQMDVSGDAQLTLAQGGRKTSSISSSNASRNNTFTNTRDAGTLPTTIRFPPLFSSDFGPAALLYPSPTLTTHMNYGEDLGLTYPHSYDSNDRNDLHSNSNSNSQVHNSPPFSSSPCRVVVFYPTQNPYNLRFYIYEY
ncbi:hypothetical protein HHX47_DHR2000979 [Lentinula edodes]|nr:hypothetical protein HHX47_DHR2000979 [Lentinula edodes]